MDHAITSNGVSLDMCNRYNMYCTEVDHAPALSGAAWCGALDLAERARPHREDTGMAGGEVPFIAVLGELQVTRSGEVCELPPSRKTRALLAYLAVTGRSHRRERLCEIFWEIPDDPRGALRWSLSKIRTVLRTDGDDPLQGDRNTVTLRAEAFRLDYSEIAQLGTDRLEGLSTKRLQDLAGLLRGHFLEDLAMPNLQEFEAWRRSHADAAELASRRVLRLLVNRLGDTPEFALKCLHALQRLDPEDEELKKEAERLSDVARQQTVRLLRPSPPLPSPGGARVGGLLNSVATESKGPAPDHSPVLEQTRAVRFCTSKDGTRLAYEMSGDGPPLVRAAHWMSHLSFDRESPMWRHWIRELEGRYSLLRYDERLNGLSDWDAQEVSFEALVDDLEAVVDAAGLQRFSLMGISQSCAVSVAYAIRHPERVSSLILLGGYAKGWRKRGNPREIALREALATLMREGWGQNNPIFRQMFAYRFLPGASDEQIAWFNDLQRRTVSPENAWRLQSMVGDIDVSDLLRKVSAPTLVLHARGDAVAPFESGVDYAAGIKGARLVPLESKNHIPLEDEPAFSHALREITTFLKDAETRLPAVSGQQERKQPLSILALEIQHPLQAREQDDPEITSSVMTAYLERAEDIIAAHGGALVSRQQSELIAAFGAGVSLEDYGRQACRAALQLKAKIEAMGDQLARVRIAIDSGEMIVKVPAAAGLATLKVSGAAARIAPNIVRALRSDGIVATSRTRDAAGGYILMQPLGSSGVPADVSDQPLFQVIAERHGPTRWHLRDNRFLAPLAGRRAELRLLEENWQRAVAGRGGAVMIAGEAGVGKSRLCVEFVEMLAPATARVVQGGALEAEASVGYGLIKKMLRSLCQIQEETSTAEATRLLQALLAQAGADDRLEMPLLFVLDLPVPQAKWATLTAADQAHRIRESVRALITLLSRERPVLVLAEDLHWADPASRQVLARLQEGAESYPLLIVCTARSAHGLAGTDQAQSLIQLQSLDTTSALALAESLLGNGPGMKTLAAALVKHTGGTPLFIEETIWMLVQTGSLEGQAGHFSARQLPETLDVPQTIQAMTAARINALSPEERDVLDLAAVVGTEVPHDILEASSGLSPHSLEAIVARLKAAQFLVEIQSYPVKVLGFRHALVHAATLDGLLRPRLAALHRLVLDAVARSFPDYAATHVERMAEHARMSGMWPEAAHYLLQAAERAHKRSAYEAALESTGQALACLSQLRQDSPTLRIELAVQKLRGLAWMGAKGWGAPEVLEAFDRAEALSRTLDDSRELFAALRGKAQYFMISGEPAAALRTTEQCQELLHGVRDEDQAIETHHMLWTNCFFIGDLAVVEDNAAKALAIYDSRRHHHLTYLYSGHDPGVCSLCFSALSAALRGNPGAARARSEEARQLAQFHGHPLSSALAEWGLGFLHMLCEEPEPALAAAERTISVCDEIRLPLLRSQAEFQSGWAMFELGDRTDGLRRMADGISSIRQTGAEMGLPYFLALYGGASARAGEHDKGLANIEAGLASARRNGAYLQYAHMLFLKAETALSRNGADQRTFEALLRQALDVATQQRSGLMLRKISMRLAEHLQQSGRQEEAARLPQDVPDVTGPAPGGPTLHS